MRAGKEWGTNNRGTHPRVQSNRDDSPRKQPSDEIDIICIVLVIDVIRIIVLGRHELQAQRGGKTSQGWEDTLSSPSPRIHISSNMQKMLVRDYIRRALYDPVLGYFTKGDIIHTPPQPLAFTSLLVSATYRLLLFM